jgi:RNA 2',3'-cyclic 3'-phosphodiesterase
MRIFVGIELDDRLREAAAAAADSLRRQLGKKIDARWIASSNLHITLWFIGEVDPERARRIAGAFDAPLTTPAFDLHLAGFGAFPPSGAPRVLWLGVTGGAESLARIHAEVAARLAPVGIEAERRPYSAHLTVARIKVVHGRDHAGLRTILGRAAADVGTGRVHHATVFRSRLSPKGAAYEALLRVPLQ